jgi:uncharacterized protein YfaS (alpha-2-macroglobulin family)
MKYLFSIIALLLIFSPSVFGQGFSSIVDYPPLYKQISFPTYEWKEIDQLKTDGLPRKAIEKIKELQNKAIVENNLKEFWLTCLQLDELLNHAQFESDEHQLFVWEFAQRADKLPFPMNNLMHYQVSKWINSIFWSGYLSFDDESLLWKIDGKEAKLTNEKAIELFDYHQKMSLSSGSELMKFSSKDFIDNNESAELNKNTITLFEVLAYKALTSPRESMIPYRGQDRFISDSTFFDLTQNFKKAIDFSDTRTFRFQLYYHLEELCLKNKRFDAYGFWSNARLKEVYSSSTFENVNNFEKDKLLISSYYKFEDFLRESAASARFSFLIAKDLNKKAKEYHWKNNTSVKLLNLTALNKIEKSLSKFSNSEFTDELTTLKKYIRSDELDFSLKGDFLKGKSSLMNVEYKNVFSAVFKIYKIQTNSLDKSNTNLLKNYGLKEVYNQILEFDRDSLYLQHGKDFIVPKLNDNGKYLFIVARSNEEIVKLLSADTLFNEKNFSYKIYQLSTIKVLTKDRDGKVEFLITNSMKGSPIENAQVYLSKRLYRRGSLSTSADTLLLTDKNGKAIFAVNESYEYKVKYANDSLTGTIYGSHRTVEETRESYKIYTDRGIYRPGQEVFIKIIGYIKNSSKGSLKVDDSHKVNVDVIDQNGKMIWSKKLKANEFGSASSSFVLPRDGFLLGNISIVVNNVSQNSIQVEEYKRPTFEVLFNAFTGKIKMGDSLTITGTVKSFAGYPITNAFVKLTVLQNNYFPRWCDISYNEKRVELNFDVVTDKNGDFRYTFLPTKGKYMHGSYFDIDAVVTDISGEVQEGSTSLFVGNESYTISMDLGSELLSSKENKVNLTVENSQSEIQKEAIVSYSLVKVTTKKWYTQTLEEAEFQGFDKKLFAKKFPTTEYFLSTNNYSYDTVFNGKVKSGEQVDINQLLGMNSGSYQFIASTIDKTGEKAVVNKEFVYIQRMDTKSALKKEFWSLPSASTSKLGDEVEILIGSNYKSMNVYVEHQNSSGVAVGKWMVVKKIMVLKYKITEAEKDGFQVTVMAGKNGKLFQNYHRINVVNEEQILSVKLLTERDLLKPGSKEKWIVAVSDSKGANASSELLVGMYDASLNQFSTNYWDNYFHQKPNFASYWYERHNSNLIVSTSKWYSQYDDYSNEMGLGNGYGSTRSKEGSLQMFKSVAAPSFGADEIASLDDSIQQEVVSSENNGGKSDKDKLVTAPRSNFNETAFFYPNVYADESGNYRFEYTLPDALTKWRFMAMAHTKDLKTGSFEKTIEVKKEVMVQPNAPRFFREGDVFVFSSKVVNLTKENQDLVVRLKLIDPITEKDVTSLFGQISEQKVTLIGTSSQEVSWTLNVPIGKMNLVAYLIEAEGKLFSDAEKRALPILSNRMLISESKAFVKTSAGDKTFTLEKMKTLSNTADKIALNIEMQTQPLWTTLMSLPYLIESKDEYAEQLFSRYFGNILAQKIINDNPSFKSVIESWMISDPKAFLSELDKNPELKSIILNETPWVLDAKDEAQKRMQLAKLFESNELNKNINSALSKLKELQLSDGGWSWVGNDKSNRYITQYIVSGFGQLKQLGITVDELLVIAALNFIDTEYDSDFKKLKSEDKVKSLGLTEMHIHWLVARTYFTSKTNATVDYYNKCLLNDWKNFNLHTQALAGLAAFKKGDKIFAEKIKNSILDRATKKQDMGMFWNENKSGYYWNQSQVETQSVLIEFFTTIGNLDKEVQLMQLWLLQQKRVNSWETSKATTLACHALLVNKTVIQNQLAQVVKVRLGDGTDLGTLKTDSGSIFTWTGKDITKEKATVTVNSTNEQPVFGAIHLQYLEDMNKIVKSQGDIRLERHYYWTNKGSEEEILSSTILPIGTKVTVKMSVTANRSMEFVHLKDSKCSGFEAREVTCGYHYSTVSYYQISKDASTEFFIDYLPKGNHLFEYEIFVTGKGELSAGAAIVECMYAPSFRANSDGKRFIVK